MNTKNTYIRDLVGRISLEQKVGALLTLGFAGIIVRPHIYEDIVKYPCGGENASTVVATNFYVRGKLTNTESLGELIRKNPGKKFVVVTDTPYEMSIPEAAGTVVVTFSTGPQNLEATAGVLFGAVMPEGEWPVAYRLPDK